MRGGVKLEPVVPTRSEKDEERDGDRVMVLYGFAPWRLSQPRATKQTPGLPDRLYTDETRGVAVWWEAKREGGRQRPAQRAFQRAVEACGDVYLLGPATVLIDWIKDQQRRGWPAARVQDPPPPTAATRRRSPSH